MQDKEIILDYYVWDLVYNINEIEYECVLVAKDKQDIIKEVKRTARTKPYRIVSMKKVIDKPINFMSHSYWRMITREMK